MTNFVKIEDETYELLGGKSIFTNYPLHLLKILRHAGCAKKTMTGQKFF